MLFGSNAVGIIGNTHAKDTGVSLYIKNTDGYDGNADNRVDNYGRVKTMFYSNRKFESEGKQWVNRTKKKESEMFGMDKWTRVS